MRTPLVALFLVTSLAAQQLVRDPYFRDTTAWQKINDKTILSGPGAVWMGSDDQNRYSVGVQQDIEVKEDGWYQFSFSGGGGGYDGAPMWGGGLHLQNFPYSDFRSGTSFIKAGPLRIAAVTERAPLYPYWARFYSLELRKVDLPVADWRLQSSITRGNCYIGITSTLRSPPTADASLLLLSTKKLDQGVPIFGIQGLLLVDPASLVLVWTKPVLQWPWWTYPWPALHAQVLEIDFDTSRFVLGSVSSSY